MEKGKSLGEIEFEVLDNDKVVCKVSKDGLVLLGDKKLDGPFCPLGFDEKSILEYFEERSVPRGRVNIKYVLQDLGLFEYNPYEMVKKTRGFMHDDTYWIRFPWDSHIKDREQLESILKKEIG